MSLIFISACILFVLNLIVYKFRFKIVPDIFMFKKGDIIKFQKFSVSEILQNTAF